MEKFYSEAVMRQAKEDLANLAESELERQGFTKDEMEDIYGEKIENEEDKIAYLKRVKEFDYSNISDQVYKLADQVRSIKKLEMDGGHPLLGMTCMECGVGKYESMKSINLKCSKCGVIQLGYIPLPAMVPMHKDRTRFKMLYGGYGVGKTTACINEDIEMALHIAGLKTLIGTSDLKQLSSVALLEFLVWCPETTIAKHNKTLQEITLTNGSLFYFRPLYDEEKIKSLTLGRAHVIESSAIKKNQQRKIFKQLQRRLRQKIYKIFRDDHTQGMADAVKEMREQTTVLKEGEFYKVDMRQIVYESNPVDNYFLDMAMTAKIIHTPDDEEHHNYEKLRPEPLKRNKIITTYTFPTWVNSKHLPEGIIEEWKSTMSPDKYLIEVEGSLKTQKFGLAFKNLKSVKPFKIPKHWKRVFSTDSGIVDSRTWGAIAIDPENLRAVVYGMVGESDWTINAHARMLIDHRNQLPDQHMFKPIQADKQLFNTRDNDKGDGFTSNAKTYERLGLNLHKADSQKQIIEQGVAHVNNIIAEDMMFVMKPYDDYSLNQGMIVQNKMSVEIFKYARNDEGKLPERKGADGPDTFRYNTGPLPSNKELLKKSIIKPFTQNIQTGAIVFEEDTREGKMVFENGIVFGKARQNASREIDKNYEEFSPFKI